MIYSVHFLWTGVSVTNPKCAARCVWNKGAVVSRPWKGCTTLERERERPTWVWGRRCWARRGTSWWFLRLWTSCAASPAVPWGTHYWGASTAVRWTCSGSCQTKKKEGRVKQREEGTSVNTPVCIIILWEWRLQLNVCIWCIYLYLGFLTLHKIYYTQFPYETLEVARLTFWAAGPGWSLLYWRAGTLPLTALSKDD